jgi:2-(1,2-epoxy-1,2-dihydrophenyl)acetyl-CoA isomerase
MPFETIICEKNDGVGIVTLNRPEKINAISPQMTLELGDAVADMGADDNIRVLVLKGAGKGFCAGADVGGEPGTQLRATMPGAEEIRRMFRGAQRVILGLQRMEKPTIAQIHGPCVGGGWDLASACDIRYGSEECRFMVAFIRIGLFPGWGGTWFMPRIMGVGRAAEYLFTGDFLGAEEALRIGVLNKMLPLENLDEETVSLARKIAAGPPIALRLAKMQLYKGLEMDLETAMQMAAACETITLTSEDHKEGVAAFREKRVALYKGL